MKERRMNKLFAMCMTGAIGFLYRRMLNWQKKHNDVVDYRITDATEGLRRAQKALGHLNADTMYPEWNAAMANLLRERLND